MEDDNRDNILNAMQTIHDNGKSLSQIFSNQQKRIKSCFNTFTPAAIICAWKSLGCVQSLVWIGLLEFRPLSK